MLFADWQGAESLLHEALEEKYHKAIPELAVYLVEGVGNSTRIDYGTGGFDLILAHRCFEAIFLANILTPAFLYIVLLV